jgi:hypothetical protein
MLPTLLFQSDDLQPFWGLEWNQDVKQSPLSSSMTLSPRKETYVAEEVVQHYTAANAVDDILHWQQYEGHQQCIITHQFHKIIIAH